MICILLCAGYATRMYPLTENFPKPLLPVKGKPIIDYLIDDLNDNRLIDEFVVVSNHKFISFFYDWKKSKTEKITVLDDGSTANENRLGAVSDIAFAIDKLGIDDDVLVLAGDNILNFSLKGFVEFAQKKRSSAVMYYEENETEKLKRTGVAVIAENGLITNMEEKPEFPKSNCAIPPFYFFCRGDLGEISKGIREGCKTDAPGGFLEWLSGRKPVFAYRMPGSRIDVGNLEQYNSIK